MKIFGINAAGSKSKLNSFNEVLTRIAKKNGWSRKQS